MRLWSLLLATLAANPAPDLIAPGQRAVRHELLIATDAQSSGRRLLLAPVHGFGTRLLRPSRPQAFSTKYGSQIWLLAEDEAPPDRLDDAWIAAHRAVPIPFHEEVSVGLGSPVARILTLCRLVPGADQQLRLQVVGEYRLDARGRPLPGGTAVPWLLAIAALGLLGLLSRARFQRRSAA